MQGSFLSRSALKNVHDLNNHENGDCSYDGGGTVKSLDMAFTLKQPSVSYLCWNVNSETLQIHTGAKDWHHRNP
jgi:hypothetical protein